MTTKLLIERKTAWDIFYKLEAFKEHPDMAGFSDGMGVVFDDDILELRRGFIEDYNRLVKKIERCPYDGKRYIMKYDSSLHVAITKKSCSFYIVKDGSRFYYEESKSCPYHLPHHVQEGKFIEIANSFLLDIQKMNRKYNLYMSEARSFVVRLHEKKMTDAFKKYI